jgi:predicted nucleic acid-binding protein
VKVLVDTCVWSLALARRTPREEPCVLALRRLIDEGEDVLLAGIVLQELLQGLRTPRQAERLVALLDPFELVVADRIDHDTVAALYRTCRAEGLTLGTVDALIAALAMRRGAHLLTVDADFERIAHVVDLSLFTVNDAPEPRGRRPQTR